MAAIEWIGTARDWLDARIPLAFPDASAWFEAAAKGVVSKPDKPPARTGYREGLKVEGSASFGSVRLWGEHPQALSWSMLSGTGGATAWAYDLAAAAPWADAVQANRIDVCVDFKVSEKAFNRIHDDAISFCRNRKLKALPMGLPENGRTLYFNRFVRDGLAKTGNEKAPHYSARLYEKGKQLGQDPDWRRFELSIRPDKGPSKRNAFSAQPGELLGAIPWSRDFLGGLGYDGCRVPERSSPYAIDCVVSDDAEAARAMWAVAAMAEQYKGAVARLVESVGREEAQRLVTMALFDHDLWGEEVPGGCGVKAVRDAAVARYAGVYSEAVARRAARH